MLAKLFFLVAFLIGITTAYYYGIYVGYYRTSTAGIFRSAPELEVAKAIHKGDIPGALHWVKMDFKARIAAVRAFPKEIRHDVKNSSAQVRDGIGTLIPPVPKVIKGKDSR